MLLLAYLIVSQLDKVSAQDIQLYMTYIIVLLILYYMPDQSNNPRPEQAKTGTGGNAGETGM